MLHIPHYTFAPDKVELTSDKHNAYWSAFSLLAKQNIKKLLGAFLLTVFHLHLKEKENANILEPGCNGHECSKIIIQCFLLTSVSQKYWRKMSISAEDTGYKLEVLSHQELLPLPWSNNKHRHKKTNVWRLSPTFISWMQWHATTQYASGQQKNFFRR